MVFRAPGYANLIADYTANFESVWRTGEGKLGPLRDKIANDAEFPIVFDSMAITWPEASSLKSLIIDNCPPIFSDEFRRNAPAHRTCAR